MLWVVLGELGLYTIILMSYAITMVHEQFILMLNELEVYIC